MSKFVLSCCTTTDVNKQFLLEKDIEFARFHYFLNEVEYIDDFGEQIPYKEFYNRMEQGETTRTSQVNVQEFCNHFEKYLKEGKDIIHITLSSGISGTYNSACIAKDMVLEKYPDRKICIIDSLGASSGYGLLVGKVADFKNKGGSFDEVCEYAKKLIPTIRYWFFSTDLKYFVRGGRISKAAGFFGSILKICPLLHVSEEGKLVVKEKVISKKRVIKAIVDKMKALAADGLDYDQECYISHSRVIEDAEAVKNLIESSFPNMKDKVRIFDIGTTIGSHTGPGTVALFFVGK